MSSSLASDSAIDPRSHAMNEFLAKWRDDSIIMQVLKERDVQSRMIDLTYYGPGGPQGREQRAHKAMLLAEAELAEMARREATVVWPKYTHVVLDWATVSGARDVLRFVLDARDAKEKAVARPGGGLTKLVMGKPNRAERRKKG